MITIQTPGHCLSIYDGNRLRVDSNSGSFPTLMHMLLINCCPHWNSWFQERLHIDWNYTTLNNDHCDDWPILSQSSLQSQMESRAECQTWTLSATPGLSLVLNAVPEMLNHHAVSGLLHQWPPRSLRFVTDFDAPTNLIFCSRIGTDVRMLDCGTAGRKLVLSLLIVYENELFLR